MAIVQFFSDYSLLVIVSLALLAFIAGFLDAIVGGGGLIQLPALLINFHDTPIATLFGTNKIAALSGTSIAAYQYSKRIKFDYKLLAVTALSSGIAAYSGAKVVSYINVNTLKPIILVILILIAIYTWFKKDLGAYQTKSLSLKRRILNGTLIGLVVGFYDGFFGPGTGSFLVLGFVVILGFEFLQASAYAKVINCMTNIAALAVFIRQGNFILGIAILMAVFNVTGNLIGARMALKKGNGFIRVFFLIIVSIMIIRYGYDIFTME